MKSDKKYYFISGLPRSGSTLLCNLLAQNSRFYVTPTSGLLPLMLAVRERWPQISELKAGADASSIARVLGGMLKGYFSHTESPVCFDKSRGWTRHIEMAEEVLGQEVKMIVCVRDIREVLASFEGLWRKNAGHRAIPQERFNYEQFQTIEGRLAAFMSEKEVVGGSYNSIRDAIHRGHAHKMLFVDFDSLTRDPARTMRIIYDFLGEEYFYHNFNNVGQVIHEKDEYYGFDDLHTIRPNIEPVSPKWRELLGEQAAARYENLSFWKDPAFGLKTNL